MIWLKYCWKQLKAPFNQSTVKMTQFSFSRLGLWERLEGCFIRRGKTENGHGKDFLSQVCTCYFVQFIFSTPSYFFHHRFSGIAFVLLRTTTPLCITLSLFNPFPNKPWFVCVCSTSLLKTMWEKEKLLVKSNFSFSHSVLYPFRDLSPPFPNKPWFVRVCSTSLSKTMWEKQKLLVASNFSFTHSVLYLFRDLSAIFIKFEIDVCKFFQVWKGLKFVVWERVKYNTWQLHLWALSLALCLWYWSFVQVF